MSTAMASGLQVDQRRSARSGLTLVEIAVALGVLSLLLAGLFASMASSMQAGVLTREHQAASEAAVQQLDVVLADPSLSFADSEAYFDVPFKTGSGVVNLPPAVPIPAGYTQARPGRVQIDQNPGGAAGNDLVQVTVTVVWRAADNTNQRLDLVSMRSR